MKRSLAAVGIAATLYTLPVSARADVPSAANSTVGARVVVCPAGDSLLLVIARDANGDPWLDDAIVVDVCSCPGLLLASEAVCSTLDPGGCRVSMVPDGHGGVQVPVMGGGLCPGGTVKVTAGGVLLAVLGEPACFDQNGDLLVDDADIDTVTGKLGGDDPGADFDGDGAVTQADLAILALHVGHNSPSAAATPAGVAAGRQQRN